MARRVQLLRFVTVIDQDHESTFEPRGHVADPVERPEVDLDAPARLEHNAQPIEVDGERRGRGRPFTRDEPAIADIHVHFAQAACAHDDLMDRQRIEQFVGDEHALER